MHTWCSDWIVSGHVLKRRKLKRYGHDDVRTGIVIGLFVVVGGDTDVYHMYVPLCRRTEVWH